MKTIMSTLMSIGFMIMPLVVGAQGVTVEGVGTAEIKGRSPSQVKQEAISRALKDCIEKVVGISIKSAFSSSMKEVVADNKNAFSAKVSETIEQNAEGFVQKYDVLSEKKDGGILEVKVRAVIFENKIQAELKKLTGLLDAAGNPKVMVVIQDILIDEAGLESVRPQSLLGSYLTDDLSKRGIEIRSQTSISSLSETSSEEFKTILNNPKKLQEEALEAGADILIMGSLRVTNRGIVKNSSFSALNGRTQILAEIHIQGIMLTNGKVIAAEPISKKEYGSDVERATHRVLKCRKAGCVKKVFESLFEGLKQAFRSIAKTGSAYRVVLKGIKNYRRQGRKFSSILEALPDVNLEHSKFDKGKLKVELTCKCTSKQLEDRIFEATETLSIFESLDLSGISGKTLRFQL
jgi:hypothetical protein